MRLLSLLLCLLGYIFAAETLSTASSFINRRGLFLDLARVGLVAVPSRAFAVESNPPKPARVAGSENAAITAAFTAQSIETNARLRASGVRVDTDEEVRRDS